MKLQTGDIRAGGRTFQFYTSTRSIAEAKKIRERWMRYGHDTRVRAGEGSLKGKILIYVENLR